MTDRSEYWWVSLPDGDVEPAQVDFDSDGAFREAWLTGCETSFSDVELIAPLGAAPKKSITLDETAE